MDDIHIQKPSEIKGLDLLCKYVLDKMYYTKIFMERGFPEKDTKNFLWKAPYDKMLFPSGAIWKLAWLHTFSFS